MGDHDSGISGSPKQSPEFGDERMSKAIPEKGTMREFIESEINVIMKNLKVKKRVSHIYYNYKRVQLEHVLI